VTITVSPAMTAPAVGEVIMIDGDTSARATALGAVPITRQIRRTGANSSRDNRRPNIGSPSGDGGGAGGEVGPASGPRPCPVKGVPRHDRIVIDPGWGADGRYSRRRGAERTAAGAG